MNAFFAVICLKIHVISRAVRITAAITQIHQCAASCSTATRYRMCPLRNTRMPIRKMGCPFSGKTRRRFSSTSAMAPNSRPVVISCAVFDPLESRKPRITKQADARPFRITAGTYSFLLSFIRNTTIRHRHTGISAYIIVESSCIFF